MKRIFFLTAIILSVQVILAQAFGSHKVAITPTAFPQSNFDKEAYKEKLYKKYANEPKTPDLDRYITQDAFYKDYFFSSNQIYSNWPEATEYVKKVFERTVPKKFNTNEVKIYVVRNPEPNAFCMEDGNIAVTAGLLSYLNNEAQLAAVLSHEFGHYYCNHLYESHKMATNPTTKFPLSGNVIASFINLYNLIKYEKDQERQADTFAYRFFITNGYSPASISETFEDFKQLQDKYELRKRKFRPLLYFSTHPSNEERITNAKSAFIGKEISGKKFLIDSLEFYNLKRRATDETIYLLFEEFKFEECLELSFEQHLYNPKDEYYLFFIIECLRRQMSLKKDFAEDLFITDKYVLKSNIHNNYTLPFLKSKMNKYMNYKNYSSSIYPNLNSTIFNINVDEIKNINSSVFRSDTIPYLFNNDALDYFKDKINDSADVFNVSRYYLNKSTVKKDNTSYATEIELKLKSDFEELERVLNNSTKSLYKSPVVLYKFKTYSNYGQATNDYLTINELISSYHSVCKKYKCDSIDVLNIFNQREYWELKNSVDIIELLNLNKFFSKKELDFDFLNVTPELAPISNKYGYSKIIYLSFNVMNIQKAEEDKSADERWAAEIYVADIKNKKIFVKGKLGQGKTRSEKIIDILNECSRIASTP